MLRTSILLSTIALTSAACTPPEDAPSSAETADTLRNGRFTRPVSNIGLAPETFTAPSAPNPVTISSATDSAVTVVFRDRASFDAANVVQRIEVEADRGVRFVGGWANVRSYGALSGWTTFVDDSIEAGKLYCYRVRTSNSYGTRTSQRSCTYDPECIYSGDKREPRPRSGGPVRTVRLLQQNVFGTSDGDCDARLSRLGNAIAQATPAFDIVGVQELYGTSDFDLVNCEADQFNDAIWSTGRYRNSSNYNRYNPVGEFFSGQPDGGIALFSLGDLQSFEEHEWDENNWTPVVDAVQGFVFARVWLPRVGMHIDTYVVHVDANVDGASRTVRRAQLAQLADEIRENSRLSGNPVLVMGDFNIGGPKTCDGNRGYRDIMEALRYPRDLWMEVRPNDATGTHEGQRIDYVFLVTDPQLTNSPYEVVVDDLRRHVKWTSDGERVSDHDGIDVTLEFHDRCPWDVNHPNYCRDCGPCEAGTGDCDSDAECKGGLVCSHDVGAQYGLPSHYDVCECPWDVGHANYCRDCGPCGYGQGDCDGDAQCGEGLTCLNDVGADFGLPASYDVCGFYVD